MKYDNIFILSPLTMKDDSNTKSIIPEGLVGEEYNDNVALIFKPSNILVKTKTKYQEVEIIENDTFGKILFLDGLLMKTDFDGYIINEMIVHVTMNTGKLKKNILVIGGGEGFTATKLLQYEEIEKIDVVDIDKEFVGIAKKYYPDSTKSFLNSKVKLHIQDGLEFIKKTRETYDLILVTSTDPSGLSSSLFTEEFYNLCYKRLSSDGIFMTDAYMPYYNLTDIDYKYMYKKVNSYYKKTKLYTCTVPSFPGGLFAFVIGSKLYDPESDIRKDLPHMKTKYYNFDIHKASFALPQFMLDKINS